MENRIRSTYYGIGNDKNRKDGRKKETRKQHKHAPHKHSPENTKRVNKKPKHTHTPHAHRTEEAETTQEKESKTDGEEESEEQNKKQEEQEEEQESDMIGSPFKMLIVQADKRREETIKEKEEKSNKDKIKVAERKNDEALIKKRPAEWINSPNRKKIAEARNRAKERLERKLLFPTEEDIGEVKTNIYRCEFGKYEGTRVIDIPHKYIEERRQMQKNGVKQGEESEKLLREYTLNAQILSLCNCLASKPIYNCSAYQQINKYCFSRDTTIQMESFI